ncbi:MAG: TonB-dependent receptor, partial [Gammaproteobacteria bacterium]
MDLLYTYMVEYAQSGIEAHALQSGGLMFLTTQFSITARNVLVAASVEVATLSVCGAADTRSRELEGLYGDEKTLEIALGYRKPLVDVPNVATVIEETDIRRVGARTLAEALVLAPGVQVVHGRGRIRLLNLRGIFADLGPDVLVKRNGVPISQGSFTTFNPFDLLPTNNIDRIEIIRGPNSALDGADALAGVVNIVTKPSVGLRGTELGGRAGSQDSYDVWLNHGSKLGPIDVALGLSAWATQGHDKTLETDVQSQMDRLLGTRSSLAPGPLNTENEGTDMELDLSTGPWQLRLGYYGVLHAGIGAGTVQVLDPDGHVETHLFNTDLVYNAALTPELELSGLFSYVNKWDFLSETFVPPGGRPGFPSGIAGEIENEARLFRGEAAAVWSGWRDHKLRVAGGAYTRTNDEPKQRANVRTTTGPGGRLIRIPLPGFREMTGNELAFPETSATTAFGSLLDEWRFAPDWTLTTGLRFDGFS